MNKFEALGKFLLERDETMVVLMEEMIKLERKVEALELQVSALVGQGLEFQKQIKRLKEHLNDPFAHGR